jgi:Na+/phosphate symporter
MYKIIGELESLGDSGESISRILSRRNIHNKHFTEQHIEKIDTMLTLVDKAYQIMINNLQADVNSKDNLRCALKREKLKADTGRTYRNAREAEQSRAYAIQYEIDHKDDPRHKEMKRRCSRNAWERRKIRDEVSILSEFFSDDSIF